MIENLFLSAGAMKAGTTWVYDKLQHNENIHFSREKEIYYFSHMDGVANSLRKDKRLRRSKIAIRKSSIDYSNKKISIAEHMDNVEWYLSYASNNLDDSWYESLFLESKRNDTSTFCADFSNLSCFLSEDGWNKVRDVARNIKVIYILRNPIDRFWSHYKFHLQFVNHDEMHNPEKNIELFKRVTSKPWFIRNSLYSDNIKKMQNNLKDEEFKIFFLDDISERPESSLKEIEDFISVSNHDYSNLGLKSKKNSSIKKDIPEEWRSLIEDSLKEEVENLKLMGIWHDNW